MINTDQVAQTLHRLHAEDRIWLLDQLSPFERDQVKHLIGQQLDEISVQGSTFEQAIAKEESQHIQDQQIQRLDTLDPGQIAYVLESEPDWVAALIFSAHDWKWKDAVIGILGVHRKASINRLCYNLHQSHPMQAALLEQLYQRALFAPRAAAVATLPLESEKYPILAVLRNRLKGVGKWRF